VVKALLAGADVTMMTSALLRHGPEHVTQVEAGLRDWLSRPRPRLAGRDPRAAEPACHPRPAGLRACQLHQDAHLLRSGRAAALSTVRARPVMLPD
jgi:hypothetical protein